MRWLLVWLVSFTSVCAAQVVDLPATGQQPYVIDEYGRQVPLYEASYALLISESNYLGTARGGWRPLEATAREMNAVSDALRRQGFVVRRATDLSSSDLITTFRDFMADFGQRPNNRLIFFFSGHGYTNSQNDMGYIVPVDALDPNINPARFYARALPIETIQIWARELAARHVLFLFDSCFSGSIFMSRGPAVAPDARGSTPSDRLAFFRGSSARPVRQFIAAGGPKEELPATSVFAPLFIEALNGRAGSTKDGYMTGKELGLWLEQTVPRFRAEQSPHSGVIRQPELAFGDMVFQQPQPAAVPNKTSPESVPPVVAIAPTTIPAQIPNALPRPVMEKITFATDTYFDFNKSNLKPEGTVKLTELASKAKNVTLEVIIAVGHTDSVEGGNEAGRQAMSVKRAEAVKSYLVQTGIDKNRIYTEGKGASQPVADNRTADGRAKNRRTEIEVVGTRTKS